MTGPAGEEVAARTAAAAAVATAAEHAMHELGVADGSRVLVAVSGGPDSAVLLHVLHSLAHGHRWQLVVAHIDHGLAGAEVRAEERHAVDALAQRCAVTLHRVAVPPGELSRSAAASGRSLEELARQRRYELLRGMADGDGADYIALGHHADDNLETVVMRLLAGSPGPHAIPTRRGRLVRPLLALRRADLRHYLVCHRLPHVADPSNSDGRYLRNRVRAQLPSLLAAVPGAAKGLAAAAEWGDLLWADAVRQARVELPWTLQLDRPGRDQSRPMMRTSVRAFDRSAPAVRLAALYRAIDAVLHTGARRRIRRRFLAPLLEPTTRAVAGHGVRIRRQGRWLTVERADAGRFVVPGPKSGYLLCVGAPPREGRSSDYRIRGTSLTARFRKAKRAPQADSQPQSGAVGAWLCDADFPVVVRSPRPGDAITLAERRVPLKRLLGRWGVAPHQRWQVPLLANASGVRAVAGSVLGYRDVSATAGGNVFVEFVHIRQRSPGESGGRSAARTGFEEGP